MRAKILKQVRVSNLNFSSYESSKGFYDPQIEITYIHIFF